VSASEHSTSNGATRRDLFKAGGALLAASAVTSFAVTDAAAQRRDDASVTLDLLVRSAADPRRRILLKGATILTVDSTVGDFARGDLLIEGKRIAAIGPDLGAASRDGNAIVVEAADCASRNGRLSPPRLGRADPRRHSQ
jgi:hypothetical protein